jgi:hypothetical protein
MTDNNLQYDILGELYANDAIRVGKYGFPQLQKENVIPDGEVRSFNYLLSTDNLEDYWIHCFCDDYQFERLWTNFNAYSKYIIKTKGFISTDFSLYRDYSDDRLIWNCYRNRVMIPTAGFGSEKTWEWCFDGLPHQSTVAITTNGTLSDLEARRLFAGGIEALVYTLHPTTIVVCGKYPQWLKSRYPEVNIMGIPSFGQQWKARCS